MSKYKFDAHCTDCAPSMTDIASGRPLSSDHPYMVIVRQLWAKQTLETKLAWHRVTCLNSRDPSDLRCYKMFAQAVRDALAA